MSEQEPVRGAILNAALKATLGDREKSYGDPSINLGLAGELKALYARYAGDKYCEAHDEAIEMMLTKVARIATGAVGHTDSYVDGAAYFAIAAECQERNLNAFSEKGGYAVGSVVVLTAGDGYTPPPPPVQPLVNHLQNKKYRYLSEFEVLTRKDTRALNEVIKISNAFKEKSKIPEPEEQGKELAFKGRKIQVGCKLFFTHSTEEEPSLLLRICGNVDLGIIEIWDPRKKERHTTLFRNVVHVA